MKLAYLAFILAVGAISAHAQVVINPGDTYTPQQVICTACAPERLPEVKVVDSTGNGDYTEIKDAVEASQPGWVILVKNGTYSRAINFTTSGTDTQPIVLKPYPGHVPEINFDESPDANPRVEINASYITVEGLEISNGYDGIKIYNDYVTIRNNQIHDNYNQGILVVNASNISIEHNKIADNGTQIPGGCMVDGVSSPKHCHGIYFSNFNCAGANKDNFVRYNHISGHGGAAIQFNGVGDTVCSEHFEDNVIERNIFENNAVGLYLYYNFDNGQIKNNQFIFHEKPNTDDDSPTFLAIWQSEDNEIEYNTFQATSSDIYPIEIYDEESKSNTVNHNLWSVKQLWWRWEGSWRSDWLGYQNITGWDSDGQVVVPVGE